MASPYGSDGSTDSTRSCSDSSHTAPTAKATAAAQVIQRKLVVLLGFWVISASVLSQLFPSVVLAHFHHDDAKTASFLGWVNGVSSLLQFLILPSLSASVDITGRKRMLILSAAAQAAAAAAWGCAPSNIVLATLTSVRISSQDVSLTSYSLLALAVSYIFSPPTCRSRRLRCPSSTSEHCIIMLAAVQVFAAT
jgi:MFS family permease